MKKMVPEPERKQHSTTKIVLFTLGGLFLFLFLFIPLTIGFFTSAQKLGNVAVIPITGVITTDGGSYLGEETISSQTIVGFIEEAASSSAIEAIVLEINSPGGTPVATEEITTAIAKVEKPVVALIRDMGASSAYWIASSTDYIVASRMSLTGSIGVISSYLEFSGLMEKYGVGYERLVAGSNKDIGTPFRKLTDSERERFQERLDLLHSYFIEDVAKNRHLPVDKVKKLATGDVFLGAEALQEGLIDELGNFAAVEHYLASQQGITSVSAVRYEREPSLFDILSEFSSQLSFRVGQGLGSILFHQESRIII